MTETLGVALAVAAAVALAVQSLALRQRTQAQSVSDVVLTVYAINLLLLLPATLLTATPTAGLTLRSMTAFAAGGLLGSLLARVALFHAIDRLGASRAEALKSTFPLVAVATAVLVLGESLSLTVGVGVLLLVGGAAAVSWDARTSPVTPTEPRAWASVGLPLAAALCLGLDPVVTAVGLSGGTPAIVGVTVRVLAAASGFGAYRCWRWLRSDQSWPGRPDRWTVVVGLANTGYLAAYLAALARAPVSVVAPILGASPLLVLGGAAVFARDDEHVTGQLAAAVGVLVAGVALVVGG